MIYNPGFSFSNINGKHRIAPLTETDMGFRTNQLYSEAIIQEEKGTIVKIYDDSKGVLKPSDSPAMQFAKIDINNNDEIINFCNRYGLISSERNFANFRNDYLFFNKSKDEFIEKIPLLHKEREDLNYFKRYVIEMRCLLELAAAIDAHDLDTIVSIITYLCLDITKLNGSPDAHVSTELFQFNHAYRRVAEDFFDYKPYNYQGFTFSEALRYFLDEMIEDLKEEEFYHSMWQPYKRKYIQYDFTEWRHLRALFDDLLSVTKIVNVTPLGEVEFSTPLKDCDYLKQLQKENLLNLARAVLSDLFKAKLESVTPELQYVNGKHQAGWRIPTLIDAMYLELFFRLSPTGQFRKCADPKCSGVGYFEWSPSKPNQKYCCNVCALRVAKEEQRKRARAKKDK